MKEYSTKISLVKNGRGVWCIDTTMGCRSGMEESTGGCYNDCYAARTARRYGYDFSRTVLRDFESVAHKREIIAEVYKVKMPFIRIGASGDPSENWEHTIKIIHELRNCNKEIVIITRHWTTLTTQQLEYLSTLNICINTSVSALDSAGLMQRCLLEYERIKPYFKSILRIVSCNFNLENETGKRLAKVQNALFTNDPTLDTVFRPSKHNRFVVDGIILVKKEVFNGKQCLASKFNRKTYMGKCSRCHEMCGVNIPSGIEYPNKKPLQKQLQFFNAIVPQSDITE